MRHSVLCFPEVLKSTSSGGGLLFPKPEQQQAASCQMVVGTKGGTQAWMALHQELCCPFCCWAVQVWSKPSVKGVLRCCHSCTDLRKLPFLPFPNSSKPPAVTMDPRTWGQKSFVLSHLAMLLLSTPSTIQNMQILFRRTSSKSNFHECLISASLPELFPIIRLQLSNGKKPLNCWR